MAAIEGVIFKDLTTRVDDRGFFREIIRVTDGFFAEGFGQMSHSLVHPGVVKAWHIHQRQVDWWYVVSGVIKVALHDCRPGSPTHRQTMELAMGDYQPVRCVRIPPGVAHGYRCTVGPANIVYVTSRIYDPGDEGRIAHDDREIGYDWLKLPPIT